LARRDSATSALRASSAGEFVIELQRCCCRRQGAAAEIVAAATISAAEMFGLPVSTTHVLSSGVAGTMVANGSGLQWSTVRSIAMAWVLTLPAAMMLSGFLYCNFVLRTAIG